MHVVEAENSTAKDESSQMEANANSTAFIAVINSTMEESLSVTHYLKRTFFSPRSKLRNQERTTNALRISKFSSNEILEAKKGGNEGMEIRADHFNFNLEILSHSTQTIAEVFNRIERTISISKHSNKRMILIKSDSGAVDAFIKKITALIIPQASGKWHFDLFSYHL